MDEACQAGPTEAPEHEAEGCAQAGGKELQEGARIMGFLERLAGRRLSNEEKAEYERIKSKESQKRFKELKMREARERGRKEAEFDAGGGLIGAFGRGVKKSAQSGGKKLKKKAKAYAKKELKKSKPSGYMNPLMPMRSSDAGFGFAPNPDNVMPVGWKKRRE